MRRALIVSAGLALLLAAAAVATYEMGLGVPVVADDTIFAVPRGAVAGRLPRLLAESGIPVSVRMAQVYVKLHPLNLKWGKHALKRGWTFPQVYEACTENPIPDDFPVTIVEGWRIADIDKALATASPPLIETGEYVKAARDPSRFKVAFSFKGKDLEGYLFPETFMMPAGKLQVDRLIQKQIDTFNERFAAPLATEVRASGRSLDELVVIASIIEREERDPANRPTVAGVIYNRLNRDWQLGVDATSRYELEDWNDRAQFLVKLRNPDDKYNTRLRKGLPPTPICSPSVDALNAALHPAKTEYFFYLHDKNGHVHFAKTAPEHEANRKKYDVY